MSTMVSVRSYSRGGNVSLGDKTLTANKTTFVNIDNKRVIRDIARHSAIGQIFPYGDTFFQNDDGIVTQGGKVTVRGDGSFIADVNATYVTRANGTTNLSVAAGPAPALAAADVNNPRIDIIAVDTGSGAYVVVAGTPTAGANTTNRNGMATLPANRIALAMILVPAGATALNQNNVVDIRP